VPLQTVSLASALSITVSRNVGSDWNAGAETEVLDEGNVGIRSGPFAGSDMDEGFAASAYDGRSNPRAKPPRIPTEKSPAGQEEELMVTTLDLDKAKCQGVFESQEDAKAPDIPGLIAPISSS